MKKNFHQVIVNELDENRDVIRTITRESIVLYPGEGKKLRNKKTKYTIDRFVCLGSNEVPEDYEEID